MCRCLEPLEYIYRDHVHTPSVREHCWWFWLVVCTDHLMLTNLSPNSKNLFFHTYRIWFPLETNISYGNFRAIFSDIWTLNSAELNFIIGGGKIARQKVRHAGPVGSQAYHTLNCLPKADKLFTATDWLASLLIDKGFGNSCDMKNLTLFLAGTADWFHIQ